MKKLFILFLITFILFGCDYLNDHDFKQAVETSKLVSEGVNQAGMPNIINFQELKTLKWIYELCDKENLICYAYFYNEYTGKIGDPIGPPGSDGKCIGYGIPFSAQYSNPEVWKRVHAEQEIGHSYERMPQPEPNGIYKPTTSDATWLIMIDPETNEPRPVYIEPKIVVSPFKLK